MFKLKQFTGLLLIVMLVATFTMQLETKADAAEPTISATVVYSSSSQDWCKSNLAQCWNYNPALYCVCKWPGDKGCVTWCNQNPTTCYQAYPDLYCYGHPLDRACR